MPSNTSKNLVSQPAVASRPPVVVVMGHIDHGKSTILDYIRKSDVVAGEAGGITQHVGAYQVEHRLSDGRTTGITFLDTPGHEAFSGIRERGAQAADIAILAVSAEDGVKPQTMEAYRTIQAAKIPYIVAITKIDKPNADIDRAKTSLGEHEIYVEGWGGDIPCVPVSAIKGTGMGELLDMIMLVADLADLKADTACPASGIVIESTLDTRKGISATLLLKQGSLSIGDFVVAGSSWAPIRFIEDFTGKKIDSATPSMPVVILGWNEMPPVGSLFETVDSKKVAENKANEARSKAAQARKTENVAAATKAADKLAPGEKSADRASLHVVLKADVIGSLEGVKHELAKLKHDKVDLKIASEGIGDINENDVKLAQSDPSIVVLGFNAAPDKKAAAMILRSPVPLDVASYSIIYELSQAVRDKLLAKVPKEYVEEMTGKAKILALFSKEKDKQVVGGKVESGTLETGNDVRITRRDAEIARGKIRELQQQKKRASEVREGYEFGMMLECKIEVAPGDRIEAVRTVEK